VQVDTPLGKEGDTALWIARLVLGEIFELVVLVFIVSDVAVTATVSILDEDLERSTYPLPARYKHWVPSSQKGMQTPEMESRIWKPPMGSLGLRGSHRPSWRSLMREKPVVAMRSVSPIHTARLFFAPG
jgi:hypothetical protein